MYMEFIHVLIMDMFPRTNGFNDINPVLSSNVECVVLLEKK
ncbi:hypothetical protein SDC9_125299 [bioreactor metagenome]|uniref:Uncharacterized protein n=1 Tax=bioreactor metagenome TaxID=1076179 RepID=A0A645CN07_9ZZZZ